MKPLPLARPFFDKALFCVITLASFVLTPLTSRAIITFTFTEMSGDVIVTGSGSWANTTGLTSAGSTGASTSLISPSSGFIVFGKSGGNVTSYSGATIVNSSFGTGNINTSGSDATGDLFALGSGGSLGLSGASGTFDSSITFSGETFSTMGINLGTRTLVTWDGGNESVVVSAVPEPATVGLLLGGVALFGVMFVRSRARRVAV